VSATDERPGLFGSTPFRLGPAPADRPAARAAGGPRPLGVRHRRHAAPPRRPALRWPLAFALYLGLSLLLVRSAWADPGGRSFGAADATLFTWYLGWVPHALAHGLNPLVTHAINAPDGANLMWSTPVVLLGLFAAPLTIAAGPVVTFTTLMTLAPALSGIALYAAARRWVSPGPAAVAGLLYAFCPYMAGADRGHLHLTFAAFPPIVVLALHDLLTRRRGARRTGILLGLAVAAEALVSEEVLAMSALVGALALAILAAQKRHAARAAAGPLAAGLAWCAAVAVVLLAYPLWTQFRGAYRVHGTLQPVDVAVNDALSFVVPTWAQWLAPGPAMTLSQKFTGSAVEVSGYLGIPLVLLLAVLAVRLRRDPLVRMLTPLFVVVAVLSLGPHLHVAGRIHRRAWLPWHLVARLPLLSSALPARLSLFLAMFAGLALAVWLEQARSRPRAAGRWLLAAVALAPLVPAPPTAAPLPVPAFFTTAAVRVIPQGSTVLVAPYPRPDQPEAMLWQAKAGYRFRLPGCYCTVPGPDGAAQFHGNATPLTTALLSVEVGTMTPADALALPGVRQAYRQLNPDAVIVGPSGHQPELVELVTRLTGQPPLSEPGGVDLWPVTFRP
jgi:hypothetical protein